MAKRKDLDSPERPATKQVRLQKLLALSGLGSRRECEDLITAGRVEVDRQAVSELGVRVDPDSQEIRVDGSPLRLPRKKTFLLHKPTGVISTSRDPWARTRVIDLVDDSHRLFTVGRLDKASSGLILVTNDGDLAQLLTHPKYGVEKTYRATVVGKPSPESIHRLRQGLYLAEGKTNVERVVVMRADKTKSLLEIVLKEGRNREIRRILARIGHKVVQLKRIAIGPLRLGEMPLGAFRELTAAEVQSLRKSAVPAAGSAEAPKKSGGPDVRIARRALDRGTKGRSREKSDRPTERSGGSARTGRSDGRGVGRSTGGTRAGARGGERPRRETGRGSGISRPGRGRPAEAGASMRRPREATVIAGEFREPMAMPADAAVETQRPAERKRVAVRPSGRDSRRERTGQGMRRTDGARSDRSSSRSGTGSGSRMGGQGRGPGRGAGGRPGAKGRRPVIQRPRKRRDAE